MYSNLRSTFRNVNNILSKSVPSSKMTNHVNQRFRILYPRSVMLIPKIWSLSSRNRREFAAYFESKSKKETYIEKLCGAKEKRAETAWNVVTTNELGVRIQKAWGQFTCYTRSWLENLRKGHHLRPLWNKRVWNHKYVSTNALCMRVRWYRCI